MLLHRLLGWVVALAYVPGCAKAWEWPWTSVESVLIESAKAGDVSRLADLLAISVGLDLDQPHHGGITALMAAAFKEKSEMVQFLLDAGADPNTASSNGWTPLMAAAAAGHAESIKVLVNADAQVNVCSGQLHLCPLHVAASRGHEDAVRLLVSQGADVTAVTQEGLTAMMEAEKNGYPDVVLALKESTGTIVGAGKTSINLANSQSSKSEL